MPFKYRFNFYGVMARLSTLLGLLSASTGAASLAFSALPGKWQDTFPGWAGSTLAIIAVVAAAGVPFATSFKQKRFQPDDTDRAGA